MDLRSEAPFTQRAQRVFERIQNIVTLNQDERSDKIRQIVTLIKQHEKMVHEKQDEKLQLYQSLFERISLVEKKSIEQSTKRQKDLLALQDSLLKAEKKCKTMFLNNKKQRQQLQKKFRSRIDAIFNKQRDLLEQVIGNTNENLGELANLEKDLPGLDMQIKYQSELRQQIEEKIYQQFLEQISELRRLFESQKSQRIHDHEQTLAKLKAVYTKFNDKIKQEEVTRERNEALVLRVVEQLVNQISTSYSSI